MFLRHVLITYVVIACLGLMTTCCAALPGTSGSEPTWFLVENEEDLNALPALAKHIGLKIPELSQDLCDRVTDNSAVQSLQLNIDSDAEAKLLGEHKFTNIRLLQIKVANTVKDHSYDFLENFPSLTTIEITDYAFVESGAARLAKATKVSSISLRLGTALTDKVLNELEAAKALTDLAVYLKSTSASSDSLGKAIGALDGVEHLSLRKCPDELGWQFLEQVRADAKLKTLSLVGGPPIPIETLGHIADLPKLVELELRGIELGEEHFQKISRVTLSSLTVGELGDDVDVKSLRHIHAMRSLGALTLAFVKLNGGLADIAPSGLKKLDLSGSDVGKADIDYIRSLDALESLSLAMTNIVKTDVETLLANDKLKEVSLQGCLGISSEEAESLKRQFPNISIQY